MVYDINMKPGQEDSEFISKFKRQASNTAIRNGIVFELILATVWGLATQMLPYGWLMAVANIIFLVISIVMADALASFFRNRFSGFVSVVVTVLIWVLIFGVFRGLF